MHYFSVILGISDCIKCRSCKKYFIAEAAGLSVPAWSVHVLLVCGVQWKSNSACTYTCISLWSMSTQEERALVVFLLVNIIHIIQTSECVNTSKGFLENKRELLRPHCSQFLCVSVLSSALRAALSFWQAGNICVKYP